MALAVISLFVVSCTQDGGTGEPGQIVIDLTAYDDYDVATLEMACGTDRPSEQFDLVDTDWKINLADIAPSCDEQLFGGGDFLSVPPGINTNFPSITGVFVRSIYLEDSTHTGFGNTMRLYPHSSETHDVMRGETLFFANSNGYLNGNATGITDAEFPGYSIDVKASVSFAAGWSAMQTELKAGTTPGTIVATIQTIRPENVGWDEPQALSIY